jgi:hypothetical protein
MTPHEATRTLVKSPPEVWAQCSDAEALERHLSGSFGEIRITRLEPETAVAWEGEQVRGTVRIEPSAWGTRVTLTAQMEEPAAPELAAEVEPEAPAPVAEVEPEPAVEPPPAEVAERPAAEEPPPGLWARLRRRFRTAPPPPEPEPELPEPPVAVEAPPIEVEAAVTKPQPDLTPPEPEPDPTPPRPDPAEVLNAALDSLGQAHHRPFSRA